MIKKWRLRERRTAAKVKHNVGEHFKCDHCDYTYMWKGIIQAHIIAKHEGVCSISVISACTKGVDGVSRRSL